MHPGYSIWLGSLPINEIRSAVYWLHDKPLFMKLFKTNNIMSNTANTVFLLIYGVTYDRGELKPLKANLTKCK